VLRGRLARPTGDAFIAAVLGAAVLTAWILVRHPAAEADAVRDPRSSHDGGATGAARLPARRLALVAIGVTPDCRKPAVHRGLKEMVPS
jgi:hypothetical protein